MNLKKKLKIPRLLIFLIVILLPITQAETSFYEGDFFSTGSSTAQVGGPGGGGSGGGTGNVPCNPLWVCQEWSRCSEDLRSRNCVDINYCNSNENPPLLLSCSEALPSGRITGCVDLISLDRVILRWKLDIFRFDILNEAIHKWRFNVNC